MNTNDRHFEQTKGACLERWSKVGDLLQEMCPELFLDLLALAETIATTPHDTALIEDEPSEEDEPCNGQSSSSIGD